MEKSLFIGTTSSKEAAVISSAEAAKYFLSREDGACLSPGEAFGDNIFAIGYAPTEHLYVPLRSDTDLKTFFIHYRGVCEVLGKNGFLYVNGETNEELCSPRQSFLFDELFHDIRIRFCHGYRPMPFKDVYDYEGVFIYESDIDNDIVWSS